MDAAPNRKTGIALRLRRPFKASPERVYQAWTQPEALTQWWCPPGWLAEEISMEPRLGAAWRIVMRETASSRKVTASGVFLDVVPATRLVYTWRWDGAFAGMPETVVTVCFDRTSTGTDVVLTQEAMPTTELWSRHRGGWIEACNRMELIL